jgi:hypothetical protein
MGFDKEDFKIGFNFHVEVLQLKGYFRRLIVYDLL